MPRHHAHENQEGRAQSNGAFIERNEERETLERALRAHIDGMVSIWSMDGTATEGTIAAVHDDVVVVAGNLTSDELDVTERVVTWIPIRHMTKVSFLSPIAPPQTEEA